MDPLTSNAAAGMRARSEALEVIANNLANATASGYKADREVYSEYVATDVAGLAWDAGWQSSAPLIEQNWTDFSQGSVVRTSNALDLALSGPGFFVVRGPHGPLYARAGTFHLSAAGEVHTAEGYPVLNTKGLPIRLDTQIGIEITADGTVYQAGQEVARFAIVDIGSAVAKAGSGYFRPENPNFQTSAVSGVTVLQGYLEQSNTSAPESMVRLVSLMRQFEMLQRALLLGGEMNRRGLEEVAKVGT